VPLLRSRRRALLLLPLVGAWLLLVSARPAVEANARPTPASVGAGREAIRALREAQEEAAGAAEVRWDNQALAGLAILASDAAGVERVGASVEQGTLKLAASVPAPLWGWVNGSVSVSGAHRGFPDIHLEAGAVTLPAWAGRGLAEAARWVLRLRGADLPPLDSLVRTVAVEPEAVRFQLVLPRRSGIVRGLIGAGGATVDADAVADIYCRLAAEARREPGASLDVHVRRAFAGSAPDPVARNRAAFVALAQLTVGSRAEDLAPATRARIKSCGKAGRILLAGRRDLAKHWTLSAALAAVLGENAAGVMGEWKELSDSLEGGSGFSFLDLAADRSGVQAARRATDPATAGAEAAYLARVSEEQLLPVRLMAAQEGLSEAQFLARYRGIDAAQYARTVAWIDRELERAR